MAITSSTPPSTAHVACRTMKWCESENCASPITKLALYTATSPVIVSTAISASSV